MLNPVISLKNSVFMQTITEKNVHQGIPVDTSMDTKTTFLKQMPTV